MIFDDKKADGVNILISALQIAAYTTAYNGESMSNRKFRCNQTREQAADVVAARTRASGGLRQAVRRRGYLGCF